MLARLFLACSPLLIASFGIESGPAPIEDVPPCSCLFSWWPSERASVEYREWIEESDLVAVGAMESMGTRFPTKRE